MKKLILLMGFPRSGKSTWAKQSGYPIVNPDSIRLVLHGEIFISSYEPAVWTLTRQMIESLFKAGHEVVILDATNINKKFRLEWDETNKWDTYIKWIKTSKKICIARAKEGNREDLIPIINRMFDEFEKPDKEKII